MTPRWMEGIFWAYLVGVEGSDLFLCGWCLCARPWMAPVTRGMASRVWRAVASKGRGMRPGAESCCAPLVEPQTQVRQRPRTIGETVILYFFWLRVLTFPLHREAIMTQAVHESVNVSLVDRCAVRPIDSPECRVANPCAQPLVCFTVSAGDGTQFKYHHLLMYRCLRYIQPRWRTQYELMFC